MGQRQHLAKAIDYCLGRWRALLHYLDDGEVPIDNNAVENSIRPRRRWGGAIGCLWAASGRASGQHHEFDRVGQAVRARFLGLPEGRV